MVFNNGTFMGLNEWILLGGQFNPISMLGEILEWKYAQKNDRKKNTSEVINKIIPIFRPLVISEKCDPCLVVSLMIFFHHMKAVIIKIMLNKNNLLFMLFENPHKM
jgi:hypothetical protein